MTSRRFLGISALFGALAAAACAQGSVDAASLGTEPGPPKSTSPAAKQDAALADAGSDPKPETEGDAEIAPIDAAVVEASVDASIDATGEASVDASVIVDAGPPPTIDGTIAAGEYGAHVGGQNMQASPGTAPTTTWYMTWSDTHLYVGVSTANVSEGLVLYLDVDPSTSNGSLAGAPYDNTKIATLPMRADFVAYVKSTYQEVRFVDATGAWSAPTTMGVSLVGAGDTREIAIPWTLIRAAGRPSSFAWLGYVTSPGGYVYGAMPTTNAGGFVGTSATYSAFYRIDDATPGSGNKPFSMIAP